MNATMNINAIANVFESMDEMGRWAESHETSREVAYAIATLAGNMDEMERIWQDPTGSETTAIVGLAWSLADEDEVHLNWGLERLDRAS